MAEQNTEMSSKGVVRYSNEQAKRITKECIETALIQLLEKKEMEKISISEIVKRAGVSRTAFYSHYQTKEDVLKSALGKTIEQIDRLTPGDLRSESYWISLFSEAVSIAAPFRLLLRADMGERILNEIAERALASVPQDAIHRDNEILWAGAVYNVLSHWVKTEPLAPPEQMARLCVRIVGFSLEPDNS